MGAPRQRLGVPDLLEHGMNGLGKPYSIVPRSDGVVP